MGLVNYAFDLHKWFFNQSGMKIIAKSRGPRFAFSASSFIKLNSPQLIL